MKAIAQRDDAGSVLVRLDDGRAVGVTFDPVSVSLPLPPMSFARFATFVPIEDEALARRAVEIVRERGVPSASS